MAHIDSDDGNTVLAEARYHARRSGYVQRVQLMLMAAGIAAFGIVAVAAAMLTTLF